MKRTLFILMILLAFFTFSSIAQANRVKLEDLGNRYSNGGPFKATLEVADAGLVGNPFTAFCLERNEYFYNWNTYYNYTINDYAELGGYSGATGGKDYLDAKTAYIYYMFRTDSTYATTDVQKKGLQAAFWYLEGESGYGSGSNYWALSTNPATNTADWWAWYYMDNANASFDNDGRVVVLNLYSGSTHLQSQLGLAYVPEPAALLLLGLGLVGIGILRRKQ